MKSTLTLAAFLCSLHPLAVMAQEPTNTNKNLSFSAHLMAYRVNPIDKLFLFNKNYKPNILLMTNFDAYNWLSTGIGIGFREGHFRTNNQQTNYLRESFLLVPVGFKHDVDVTPANATNGLRSIQLGGGLYYNALVQRTDFSINQQTQTTERNKDYFLYGRFGYLGNIGLRLINKNNRQHLFGLKIFSDFNSKHFFGKTIDFSPSYESMSLYYNLVNLNW